jgi:hypothetical protein
VPKADLAVRWETVDQGAAVRRPVLLGRAGSHLRLQPEVAATVLAANRPSFGCSRGRAAWSAEGGAQTGIRLVLDGGGDGAHQFRSKT